MSIYPNPSNGLVNFSFPELSPNYSIEIRIYDMLGQKVFSHTMDGSEHFLWNGTSGNGSELPSGTYLYFIDADDSKSIAQGKIIITK